MNRLTEPTVRAFFQLAHWPVLRVKALVDGYTYPVTDERYFEFPPREVWWFVKTDLGWIEIGWRKRVIVIDWTDTAIRAVVTEDDVTKSTSNVHAWSEENAVRYLKNLRLLAVVPA